MRLRPLHKLLHKKLRIPQSAVRPVLSRLRILGHPADHMRRTALARELLRDSPRAAWVPGARGYRCFQAHELPGAAEAAACAARVFAGLDPGDPLFPKKADFLQVVASGEALTGRAEILRFAVSRPLVDAASGYLGAVPRLVSVALLWSPANRSAMRSQLFHVDDEDARMLKVFLHVWEVTPEHGPFTFLPADVSRRVQRQIGPVIRRASDEQVLGAAGEPPVSVCGGPGSGVLVDTARCLHYGSRGNSKERLVLQLHFLRHDAPSEASLPCGFGPNLAGLTPDPVQRQVLGLSG
jgi:hypothetical protein